jgi:dienelactone hydrolase
MTARIIFILPCLLTIMNLRSQGVDLAYRDDTTRLRGYYSMPLKKTDPKKISVIIVHAWMGITAHEKATVDRLSALGYRAMAADIYGEKVRPANAKEASAAAGFYKTHIDLYHSRLRAAIEALVKQGAAPDQIVVAGYCFGGTGAIEAGRAGIPAKGIVSFHGGLGKDSTRKNQPVSARVLILHGADDPFVPEKDIKKFQDEMREGKTDWQMICYSNAVHAFTDPSAGNDNSKGAAYNAKADQRSWKAFMNFLDELGAD